MMRCVLIPCLYVAFQGQFFSGSNYKIYLLGNPLVWWGNLILLVIYTATQLTISVRDQRGCTYDRLTAGKMYDVLEESFSSHALVTALNSRLSYAGTWLFIAWFVHYIPFYAMGRVLYFHHYFPASVFSTMLSAVLLDYALRLTSSKLSSYIGETAYHWGYGVVLSVVVYSFYLFSPLAYGIISEGPNANNGSMVSLKWLESWEF